MQIEIIRYRHSPWAIDGELRIAGLKVCDTSENARHHIAAGTYSIRIDRCHHYRRKMPIILVEGNSINHKPYTINPPCARCKRHKVASLHASLPCFCPQIKIGNGVANRTDGSIIIGQLRLSGLMLESAPCFDRFLDRLDKAEMRGEAITLTIK